MTSAVIYGCAGEHLTAEEAAFFQQQQPLGFILFARNCQNPDQIRELVAELKSTVAHEQVPVLIDQEGGRVARLRPPHWRAYPPAEIFVNLSAHSQESAIRACYLNARLIAHDLSALGINTNCAPVADLRLQGAHDIIGDRAFGGTAHDIVPLARAQAQGLMDGGVIPVLKHIPGHGRAMVDSHHDLPIVAESLEVLDQSDFEPFRQLADLPMGMTAHIRYSAIDEAQPATLSPRAISLIREQIGFGGLLMSDDISMKALNGDLSELTAAALAAGCDVVLHCNGDMDEMQRVAKGARELDIAGQERAQRAFHAIGFAATTDVAAIETELASLLPQSAAA